MFESDLQESKSSSFQQTKIEAVKEFDYRYFMYSMSFRASRDLPKASPSLLTSHVTLTHWLLRTHNPRPVHLHIVFRGDATSISSAEDDIEH